LRPKKFQSFSKKTTQGIFHFCCVFRHSDHSVWNNITSIFTLFNVTENDSNITAKLILGSEFVQKNVFLNVTGLLANLICVSCCDDVLWLHKNVSSGVLKCCRCKHVGWFTTNYDVMKFFCCCKLLLIQFNQLLLALTYLPFCIASHATFYIWLKVNSAAIFELGLLGRFASVSQLCTVTDLFRKLLSCLETHARI